MAVGAGGGGGPGGGGGTGTSAPAGPGGPARAESNYRYGAPYGFANLSHGERQAHDQLTDAAIHAGFSGRRRSRYSATEVRRSDIVELGGTKWPLSQAVMQTRLGNFRYQPLEP